MDTLTVQNESGQVVGFSFDLSNPSDIDRKAALQQRIQRGELSVATKSAKSTNRRAARPKDLHDGVKDEKGDLLTSIHAGGLDPEHVAADAQPVIDAVEKMAENAEESGVKLSATTEAVAVTVEATAEAAEAGTKRSRGKSQ